MALEALALLCGLEGEGSVRSERNGDSELLVARTEAVHRIPEGHHAEDLPVESLERHEQLVRRMPTFRPVDDGRAGRNEPCARMLRPVECVARDEVRALAPKPRMEERFPGVDVVHRTKERLTDRIASVHDRDVEVVPLRAVDVQDDRFETERLRDSPRDRAEDRADLGTAADRACDVEQGAQGGRVLRCSRSGWRGLRDSGVFCHGRSVS